MKIEPGDIVEVNKSFLEDILGTTITLKKNRNGKVIGNYISDSMVELKVKKKPNTLIITKIKPQNIKKVNTSREYKEEWQYDKILLKQIFDTDLPFKKDRGSLNRSYIFCNKAYITIDFKLGDSNKNLELLYSGFCRIKELSITGDFFKFKLDKIMYIVTIKNGEYVLLIPNTKSSKDDNMYSISIKVLPNSGCKISYINDIDF